MKIVLFTDTLGDLNGVSRFIQDMGELAHRDGIEFVIATSTNKPLPNKSYIRNLDFHLKIPMPFYQELDLVWPNKQAIRTLLQEEKPDIVHISTPGPFGWVAKRLAEQAGLPLVGTYHTDFPYYMRDLTGSNWVKRRTDRVMANFYRSFVHVFSRSEQYLEIMANDIELDYANTSVIYPGTNLVKFNPDHYDALVWKKYGLSRKRLKVLYVGRINIEKNIPFLTQIWRELLQEYPEIKADLILVGEGRYRKWADKLRAHHAYFLGPIVGERLSKVYATSDLFVFPSNTDTLGQVVMEAQASGVETLVSDIGGPQTLIQEGISGHVLRADDADIWRQSLADKLRAIQSFRETSKGNEKGRAQLCGTPDATQVTNKQACVECMQQYNIEQSFSHFMQQHRLIYQACQTSQTEKGHF